MNAYTILGVRPNATDADIDRAGRLLAAQYHPDRPDGGDLNKFMEITDARAAINRLNREKYDLRRRMEGLLCARCDGQGEVTEPISFIATKTIMCPACGGTGDKQ